jgi:hypothetical protein
MYPAMKRISLLFFVIVGVTLLLSGAIAQAQSNTSPGSVPARDTTAIIGQPFSELQAPFVPRDTSIKGIILIHLLDQDLKPYSGYEFRLEYKDFATKTWRLYKGYQLKVDYNEGKERIQVIISDLPNGYYRGWAQCLRTCTTGWVPILQDLTQEDDPLTVSQYTLQIPQRQYWLPEPKNQAQSEPPPTITEQHPEKQPKQMNKQQRKRSRS